MSESDSKGLQTDSNGLISPSFGRESGRSRVIRLGRARLLFVVD